jgi:hypothetical protein
MKCSLSGHIPNVGLSVKDAQRPALRLRGQRKHTYKQQKQAQMHD